MLTTVTPFLIVDDLSATLAFYHSRLGFNVLYKDGGDGDAPTFSADIGRDRNAHVEGDHAGDSSCHFDFRTRPRPRTHQRWFSGMRSQAFTSRG
jgi:catechol 2,3-dioxygenase-like lactoylglutathione lyase family enzyme